jgi:subtilisin family serine protease
MRTAAFFLLLVAIVAAANVAPLLQADSPTVIPGSYIVVLKDTVSRLDRNAHVLALKDKNVKIDYEYDSINGFAAHFNEDMLKEELAHPFVKYIEADQVASISTQEVPRAPLATVTQMGATWGISRVWQKNATTSTVPGNYVYPENAGEGVDVYVIDTGILTTHTDFGGRATTVYNAVTNEASTDLNGHGTHCAGTVGGNVYGVAKKVTLYAVKVLNAQGSGAWTGVIAGVDYVTSNRDKNRPAISSMSLGGGITQAVDDAIQRSIDSGVNVVVAAGNNNANACNYSPARAPNAVTVGATAWNTPAGTQDTRATYSNFGTCVDIFAPGTSITSDWIGSNTAVNTISGTSMATPHVAGVLATYLSTKPANNSPASTKAWVIAQATPGIVGNPGTGSPNVFLYQNPAL